MRIRLERLRIESTDIPTNFSLTCAYYQLLMGSPINEPEPVLVEECGSDSHGRLWVIKKGKENYVAAMLAGRRDIPAVYKEVASANVSQ